MVACVDSAADVHASANGPVLLEVGVVAFDRRSIGALLLPDLVCAAITLVTPVLGCADVIRWIMVTHRLDNIVLNERIFCPSVEGKVCSTVGFECASIIHQPCNNVSTKVVCDVGSDVLTCLAG